MSGLNTIDFSPQEKRAYRTRQDPFADEWPGILEILAANSEVGAKAILELLISENPDKFNWTHLRTLQRGVRRWREQEARISAQPLPAMPQPALNPSPTLVGSIAE